MPCAAISDAKFKPLLMSSSYVPISAIRPSSITTTRSALGRYCSAFVTNTRVAFRNTPSRDSTSANKACPTWLSTAERGSSRKYTSAAAYTALAIATLCFCPPESVTPRSPMMVPSPPGRISKSVLSCEALTHRSYFVASNGLPNKMFSRIVLFRIQACCATYATLPDTEKSPSTFGTKRFRADRNVDLPHPTLPITMVRDPGFKSKSIPERTKGGCSGSSALIATWSGAGASSTPLTGTPRVFFGFFGFAFFAAGAGSSAAFLGALGHRNVALLIFTLPGSDMSGSTKIDSSCSRNAPRRCTAARAFSNVVNRNGTKIRGKRSMLNNARAVYAVDALSLFPAKEYDPKEHTAMNTGVENSATPNRAPTRCDCHISFTSLSRISRTLCANALSQA